MKQVTLLNQGRFFRVKETAPVRRDRDIAEVLDNLRRVFRVVHRYSKRAEKVGGLTGPQVWAMKVIAESAPIRVTDLSRRMYLHPSTVVGILDRLEQQAQVARTRSEKDHRVVTVALTAKGRETVSKVPRIAQGLLLKGLKGLTDSELSTVSEGLRMMVGILGVEGMPPPLLLSPEVNVPEGKLTDETSTPGAAR
jgi:DNA-binding MarR family transcriptional regulator